MSATIHGLEQLIGRAGRLLKHVRNRRPPLRRAADYIKQSIDENFAAQGRPRWRGLAGSTRRYRKGKGILDVSGTLRRSFKPQITDSSAAQKSNAIYGPRQNFGYKAGKGKRGRGHAPTPAREFAKLQSQDAPVIGDFFLTHISQ